jgi:hypothetical protein
MPTAISYREIQLALRTVLLTVSTLPANRAWENQGPYDPAKHPGQSYVLEQFAPGSSQLYTASANGANGIKDVRGLYLVQWFAQSGDGTPNVGGITELRDGPDAILSAFPPGKGFPMTSGLVLRVRGDQAPFPSQITPLETGFSYVTVTIPWVCYTNT